MSSIFSGVEAFRASLDYHLERHNILASNVAHVNTPGYVPRDLARTNPTSFGDALKVAMARTNPTHLSGVDPSANAIGQVFTDATAGAGSDGNAVSLDREASKIAANHVRYDVLAELVSGKLGSLAWAANDAKG